MKMIRDETSNEKKKTIELHHQIKVSDVTTALTYGSL